jgi:signal transduction histidine kinase
LLYPIAIFAIIAPTVIMGLFGAYALREIELRPSLYRQDLRTVQTGLEQALEGRIAALAIKPPADEADLARVSAGVDDYFRDYSRSLASRCIIGVGSEVKLVRNLDGSNASNLPPGLQQLLLTGPAGGGNRIAREVLNTDVTGGQRQPSTTLVYIDTQTRGFIAWELLPGQLERAINDFIDSVELENDSLSLSVVPRNELSWQINPGQSVETVGFVPVHQSLLPSRYVVLRIDADRQFYKDSTLLSSIFIIIAVLCVPIVASATLMVVHMILREASEARKKVDFVSNVTHELKTPLTSIRMFVETLKLGRVKDQKQVNACLDVIMSETERLGALIDHVLSFSKVENQVKKYNMQPNNLSQVAKDTVALFKAQIPAQHRDGVRIKILPGVPSLAMFDKDAVREVLLNLLSNAVKYSGEEKSVVVQVGADQRDLWFSVQDKGIGIDPEDQPRVFEKFFRVDEALTRKVDGTGLGLAICKEIVQAHRGKINLISARGHGSQFTVAIPYVPPAAASTRRRTTGLQKSADSARVPAVERNPESTQTEQLAAEPTPVPASGDKA